jgi:Ankyrin repeats (many copies)/Ankyrin repeats (3 copies)
MEPLLDAIVNDDQAQVRRLLAANPGLATRPVDRARLYEVEFVHWIYAGDTALHLAAAGYRVEIVEILLSAGANPNTSANHRGSAPLHYAADGSVPGPRWNPVRQVQTLQKLIDAGALVDARDKNGATPLHRAVRTRSADAVECLLAAGADGTLRNRSGSTPFHLAVQDTGREGGGSEPARAGQRRIIQTFLAMGFETNVCDGRGKSVLACARSPLVRDWLRGST